MDLFGPKYGAHFSYFFTSAASATPRSVYFVFLTHCIIRDRSAVSAAKILLITFIDTVLECSKGVDFVFSACVYSINNSPLQKEDYICYSTSLFMYNIYSNIWYVMIIS